jgi:hypothetical protein
MAEISLELIGRRLDAIQTELREFKFAVDVDRRDSASWRTNLVIEIGAKLATFELRIDNRLAQMDERLGQMDERLGQMDEELTQVGGKLAQMDEKLGQLDARLAGIETLLRQLVAK